jgi:hypothetical protein
VAIACLAILVLQTCYNYVRKRPKVVTITTKGPYNGRLHSSANKVNRKLAIHKNNNNNNNNSGL